MSQIHWRFSKNAKYLTAFGVIAIILVSTFAFLSIQADSPFSDAAQMFNEIASAAEQALNGSKSSGVIGSQPLNNAAWMQVAANAWAYFQPGVGVDSNTGLPYAEGSSFRSFTDWDLGVYIQAIIDAQELGLISSTGTWGSDARITKIFTYLENRPLNSEGYPYQFYYATTGKPDISISASETVDIVDTGRLFVALNNLIDFNSTWKLPADDFVYDTSANRSNYTALVSGLEVNAGSNSIYAYYFISGFASFWPLQLSNIPSEIMNNIANSNTVSTYNVTLPNAPICCDPLLSAVFELNSSSSQLMDLTEQVYLAHQAYYDTTGQYVAFSEGNAFSGEYIYEWVVSGGKTWQIVTTDGAPYSGNAVIYSKVAFGFLALNDTSFARSMIVYLEKTLPNPTNGYSDGADNKGNTVSGTGSGTNGLILDAALYAIQNNA